MLPASFEGFRGHVAIGALLRLRRIVERARALPGNSAGLPVVVFVEAAEPAIVIHRHVEVHLVAGGAELRRLRSHERLEEDAAVRLRIQPDQEIMQRARHRILRGREFVQLGILQIKIAPGPSCSSRRRWSGTSCSRVRPAIRAMHDLLDRRIHQPAVEHGGIVASAAPLRRLGADRILHVLDRLAVPLIVERRKVVRRTEPLVVDIFVAALAGVGLHEKLAGNFLLAVDLRRTGEERALGAVAFAIHVVGRHRGF